MPPTVLGGYSVIPANIMDQYYPAGKVSTEKYPELGRRTTSREVREAFNLAREAGLYRFDER
jgi:putative pyruvate formate lyase activating enzyme